MNQIPHDNNVAEPASMPVCLTIAGLDPSGGAGILADVKTFTAFGCFATAVISSITFQNTTGVFGAIHQSDASVRGQAVPILDDFQVAAMKTGMLPSAEVIEESARLILEYGLEKNLVVDPVVRSTSGFDLIDDAALRSLIHRLFPISAVVTPNIPEAERIARIEIRTTEDLSEAARIMQSMGARSVLIKGGHLTGPSAEDADPKAIDRLFIGEDLHIFEGPYLRTGATHGTGCTLSAAITANLALGRSLTESVGSAKEFVAKGIRDAPGLGHGHSPIKI